MIRAAIVGTGWWGRTLVNAVRDHSPAIRFTTGYSRTRANAAAFCEEHGLALADTLDALLADPAVDAVVYATPHSQHGAQVEMTARAGKHVFMEKPFTLDLASAEAALAAVAKAGVVLGVGYPRRFHPAIIELKARIADGRLGAIGHCAGEQTTPAGLTMAADYWRADPKEAPAGAMTASGVHNLDAMIHLFGGIDEVCCHDRRRAVEYGCTDTTSVMLGMRNGMSASLFCSLASAVSYRLAVFGSKGCAEIARPSFEFRFTPMAERRGPGRQVAPEPEVIRHDGFNVLLAELEAFAGAIEGGPAYPIPAPEILHGVAALDAIVRSAATGRPVRVAHTL
jgi:predicted dehydrogenase